MKRHIMLTFLSFSFNFGYSQTKDTISNPLEKYFLENYDSTVLLTEIGSWSNSPNIYIIAKESSDVYYYKYSLKHKNYKGRLLGPLKSGLTEKLNQLDFDIKNNKPAINHFFRYIYHHKESSSAIWKMINQDGLWNFNDDFSLKDNNNVQIVDGVTEKLKLITKDKVVTLQYYEPKEMNNYKFNNTRFKISELVKLITDFVSDDVVFLN